MSDYLARRNCSRNQTFSFCSFVASNRFHLQFGTLFKLVGWRRSRHGISSCQWSTGAAPILLTALLAICRTRKANSCGALLIREHFDGQNAGLGGKDPWRC